VGEKMNPIPTTGPGEHDEVVQRSPKMGLRFQWVFTLALVSSVGFIAAIYFVAERKSETAQLPFHTPTPCTPQIFDVSPPAYPNEQNTSINSRPAEGAENWYPLLYTRSFQTTDSPQSVLQF